MKRRYELKHAGRRQANADRLGLTLAEYLALPRPERKRRLQARRAVVS